MNHSVLEIRLVPISGKQLISEYVRINLINV